MNQSTIFLFIGVWIMAAVGFVGAVYNFQQAEQMFPHSHPFLSAGQLPEVKTLIKESSDIHKEETGRLALQIANVNQTAMQIEPLEQNTIAAIQDMRQEIAILQALQDVPKLAKPTPSGDTANFELVTKLTNGDLKDIFNRGDYIVIAGVWDPSEPYRIVIIGPNDFEIVKEKTSNTFKDGTFTEVFITSDTTPIGIYIAKLTIGMDRDTITFEIR